MKYLYGYLALFVLTVIITAMVFAWFPSFIPCFVREDDLIENLTALFFLLSFFLSIMMFRKVNQHKKTLLLTGAMGLLCFLEEISYGEDIFGFHAPMVYGFKFDALHDLFSILVKGAKDCAQAHGQLLLFLPAAGAALAMFVLFRVYRAECMHLARLGFRSEQHILFLICLISVCLALVLDLNIVRSTFLSMVEEVLEMDAGIALCFILFSMFDAGRIEGDAGIPSRR